MSSAARVDGMPDPRTEIARAYHGDDIFFAGAGLGH
jgi:hypothetical protein